MRSELELQNYDVVLGSKLQMKHRFSELTRNKANSEDVRAPKIMLLRFVCGVTINHPTQTELQCVISICLGDFFLNDPTSQSLQNVNC